MTISIDLAAPRGRITLERQRIYTKGGPRKDNGEAKLAELLGPEWCYEWWQYPLETCYPFTPDFWRPPTQSQPELHIELTWLDWAIDRARSRIANDADRSRRACRFREKSAQELPLLVQRWDRKRRKVDETNRLYGSKDGLEVILVTRAIGDSAKSLADLLAAAK